MPPSTLGPRSSPPPASPNPEDDLPDGMTSGSSNPLSMISDAVDGVSDAMGSGVAAWSAAKANAGAQLQATQMAPQAELVQYFVNMGINPATAVGLAQKVSTMETPTPPLANGIKIRMSSWPGDAGPQQGGSMTDYVKAAGSAVGTDTAAKPDVQGLSKVFTVDEWNALPDTAKRDLIRGATDKPKDSPPADGPGFSGIIKPINPSKT